MTTESKRRRLERSPELKVMVLAQCERPGASVANVAMAHGINANLVHGWRRLEREQRHAASAALDEVRGDAEEANAVPFPRRHRHSRPHTSRPYATDGSRMRTAG
ncbi:transposase [Variovorax sp.]|uniref:transposase n=1 Tax=Variovorax sp. TaxID=1871043 RepID=UPI0037D9ADD5